MYLYGAVAPVGTAPEDRPVTHYIETNPTNPMSPAGPARQPRAHEGLAQPEDSDASPPVGSHTPSTTIDADDDDGASAEAIVTALMKEHGQPYAYRPDVRGRMMRDGVSKDDADAMLEAAISQGFLVQSEDSEGVKLSVPTGLDGVGADGEDTHPLPEPAGAANSGSGEVEPKVAMAELSSTEEPADQQDEEERDKGHQPSLPKGACGASDGPTGGTEADEAQGTRLFIAGYLVHPLAALFPPLPEDELRQLADSIERGKLRNRIIVHKGEISPPSLSMAHVWRMPTATSRHPQASSTPSPSLS